MIARTAARSALTSAGLAVLVVLVFAAFVASLVVPMVADGGCNPGGGALDGGTCIDEGRAP